MEDNQNAVTQTENKIEESVDTQATKNKDEEKTFTQADLNKLEMKLESKYKEKYKDYDNWLESQKTAEEKQQEQNKKHLETENELTSAKQLISVFNSGVSKEEADFVQYKVSKMEGNFEDNLKEFLKENPKYLQSVETPKTDGVATKKISDNAEDGVMSILKQKHPNDF